MTSPTQPGTRLDGGRYEVKGLLGEGSQGVTYEATDAHPGKLVAVKRFDVRGARSWKDVELAEREARVLATLDHPLVPRYLANFEEDGALYLVMDKVEGESLESLRRRQGPLPEAEVRRFLSCADRALTYLHGRGAPVVHRDLKPGNVIRRPDGTYVLVDFGAVTELLTKKGSSTIVGTVGYIAPEQLQGRATASSDVYAVGATAVAALTGADPETLPHRGLRLDVRAALAGRASDGMIAALERMMEPDPDLRAKSVGAALDEAVEGATTAPPYAQAPAYPAPAVHAAPGLPIARIEEDAVVKSLRKLLWAVWGIGWIIVPMIFGEMLGKGDFIPIIMFGWMALNLVVGWHKGAFIRFLLRQWNVEGRAGAGSVRHRVDVGSPSPQVRVRTSELGPEEVVAGTEVERRGAQRDDRRDARRAR
jgi:hypothetical protein